MIQGNSYSLFSEMMSQVNGGSATNPRSTDAAHAIEFRCERAMVQFSGKDWPSDWMER